LIILLIKEILLGYAMSNQYPYGEFFCFPASRYHP
jgi:hypothetical protein